MNKFSGQLSISILKLLYDIAPLPILWNGVVVRYSDRVSQEKAVMCTLRVLTNIVKIFIFLNW